MTKPPGSLSTQPRAPISLAIHLRLNVAEPDLPRDTFVTRLWRYSRGTRNSEQRGPLARFPFVARLIPRCRRVGVHAKERARTEDLLTGSLSHRCIIIACTCAPLGPTRHVALGQPDRANLFFFFTCSPKNAAVDALQADRRVH